MKLVNKTPNGQITYCPHHEKFHLEFGNIFLHLSRTELQEFCDYVKSIDYQYYYRLNKNSSNIRKLLLHVGFNNVQFALHVNELMELRKLLTLYSKDELVQNKEIIDMNMIFN